MGNLRFELQKIHSHERGDLFVFLDKAVPENAAEGTDGEKAAGVKREEVSHVASFIICLPTDNC